MHIFYWSKRIEHTIFNKEKSASFLLKHYMTLIKIPEKQRMKRKRRKKRACAKKSHHSLSFAIVLYFPKFRWYHKWLSSAFESCKALNLISFFSGVISIFLFLTLENWTVNLIVTAKIGYSTPMPEFILRYCCCCFCFCWKCKYLRLDFVECIAYSFLYASF